MQELLIPVGVLGGMGIVFAGLLGIAAKAFHVEVDETEVEVRQALPGANCGACGYPGCDGYAKAVAEGKAPINLCSVGGKPVAEKVAAIMGQEAGDMQRMVATVHCNGTHDNTETIFEYRGTQDCRTIKNLGGGSCKACKYACEGCGTCVNVCEYDAIHIINGVAVVDEEKCVACKKCIKICPKNIIHLTPYGQKAFVRCSSYDNGKNVRANCKVGCIGCSLCTKLAPNEFEMDGKLAKVKYSKDFDIEAAKKAAAKCPAKCIIITDETSRPVEVVVNKPEVAAK
ncbi:MAG: RnfABCDGE type electron transport complex subunit B [Tissierellia bacterium]|nr:RnfABCDGE type electron transport complex subunit B [Tissierellia bacterium]